jgi:choline-glycine betaine transporter
MNQPPEFCPYCGRPVVAVEDAADLLLAAVALSVLLVGGGGTLQALAVLTGAPFAVLAVLALIGLSVALYREERGRGHTSVVRQVLDRLPTIQAHHDLDPPDRES